VTLLRPHDHPQTEAFTDLAANVQDSIARIVDSKFIPHRDSVRGFVFDVATGKLDELTAA